ncbi:MAG: TVP38/TMEM64 family protein [Firmicutes bacterium]|nr:TVP38/TMEM64 family protein [Bacillota bacterium]
MSKKLLELNKYLGAIIIFIIIIYIINKLNIFNGYSPEDIKIYLDTFGVLAPIVYIIIFTIVPLTLFPDSILAIAGGMGFGLLKGCIYTLIGALFGATLSFYISRLLGRNFLKKLIKKDITPLKEQLENNGFWIILILRCIPLFPFDIISYAAGLSEVKYKDFFIATIIGTIPGIFVYTNVGDKSTQIGSTNFYVSILLLLLLFVVSFFLKKKTIRNFQHTMDKIN